MTPSEPGVEDVTEEQRSESAGEERRAAKIILTLEKKENRNDNELGAGEKARLSAQVLDENGEDISEAVTVKFESVDAKVLALMDEAATGTETQVQAVAVGACEVRASAGSVTETVKVTVKPAPTALTFAQESLMAGVNEEIQLKYEINAGSLGEVDADGWYSSNEAVATVKGGVVKTHAAGTAVIRAVITNAFLGTRVEGYCTISVLEKPETFSLNYTSLSLNEGQKIELKASFDGKDVYAHVSYSVPADQDEVVLTDKGENIVEVYAVREGKTVVTAYINESLSATCEIEVLEAASQIELGTARTEIGVGEIISLNPVVKTGRGKVLETVGVTVKSSNRAFVDVEGTRIKGVKTGSAVITLTTDNGYEKQISYTVRKAPAKVTLGKTTETLPVGETCTLTAELPSGTAGAIHWTSADERIAVVEEGKENGAATVRAIGEGTVKVTAKTYNGHTAVCTVKVTPVAEKIAFEKSSYVLSKGMTLMPKLVFEPENATGFARFAIVDESAEGIATIDERTGEVRALGEGSIQIDATVQTANGQALTAKAYVQLKPEIAQDSAFRKRAAECGGRNEGGSRRDLRAFSGCLRCERRGKSRRGDCAFHEQQQDRGCKWSSDQGCKDRNGDDHAQRGGCVEEDKGYRRESADEREAESDEPDGFRGRDGGIAGDASERGWHGRVENRRYGHRGNRKDGSCEREHDEGFAAHGKSRNGDDHSDFL